MLERSTASRTLLRLVSDIILTELALLLAGGLTTWLSTDLQAIGEQTFPTWPICALVAVIWGVALLLAPIDLSRIQRAVDEAQTIFLTVTLATLALAGVLFFLYPHHFRLQVLTFYLLDSVLLIGTRLVVRLILKLLGKPRYPRRRVLVLGTGDGGRDAIRMIERHDWAGLEPVGFLDDSLAPQTVVEGYPVLGPIEDVAHHVRSEEIEEVVVALPLEAYDRFFEMMDGLRALPTRVRVVPDHFKTTLFRSRVEEFAGVPMIALQQPTLAPFERWVKRAFDVAVGTVTLIAISPILALVAIAVRIDSPGPVIFKQERIGENGRRFSMYKFRSMVKDAEKQQDQVIRIDADGKIQHKHSDDPRVTRVGKLLRRTSLDEFPQLVNVLRGEMSLVGPRPELPWLVEHFEPWQWQRFSVPQGITGWWQVNGRSSKPLHLHTEEDLFYIQNYSLLLDIQILWRTVGAVLKKKGAY
jgi:exopolysaccharide biosynthesis polyprenyl glycosylphosphotransferase